MLALIYRETFGSDGLVRSFRAFQNDSPFAFANCRREFCHLPKSLESAAMARIGERGRSLVERVHITAGKRVPHLVIDSHTLVVRVNHQSSWDDVMRRIIQALEDISKDRVTVTME